MLRPSRTHCVKILTVSPAIDFCVMSVGRGSHLSLQFADLILQLPARTFESGIDREIKIGMPLIILRGVANIYFAALRQGKPNADSIQAALVMMLAWRLNHHPTGSDPAEALLKLDEMLAYCVADVRVRVDAVKVYPDGAFHVYHRCFCN